MINWSDMKINFSGVGHRFEVTPDGLASSVFIKKILEEGNGCFSKLFFEGYSEKPMDEFIKMAVELGGKKIYENTYSSHSDESLFMMDDAFLSISGTKAKYFTVQLASRNEKITETCKKFFATCFTTPNKKGYVFAILRNSQGNLHMTRIGHAGVAAVKDNYSESVTKDYDYVIKDLKSKDPSGRIILLDGPPGTGKTYLVRAILMDVPDAMFVIVPPSMVASLGGPDLLPLLLKNKEEYNKKGPTILILEDADQCLAPRASDNISSISSILNMGDGIFGSLFDIRILATTNAKSKELDPAVIRDGRLSKKINIGPLQYKEANVIFKRLLKNEEASLPKPEVEDRGMKPQEVKNKFTLAEVYKAARDAGWEPEPSVDKDDAVKDAGYYVDDDAEDF